MIVEKTVCDECGAIKAESNHWRKIGVEWLNNLKERAISVEIGTLSGPHGSYPYEVQDLCGEQCLHKRIDKLLAATQ